MPDDLSRQIEACKSRIASARSRIRALQAAAEASSEAEQQLAREVAFLRTLEDIPSEKELNAEPEPGAAMRVCAQSHCIRRGRRP